MDTPSLPTPPTPPPAYPTAAETRLRPSGNDKIWAIFSHLSIFIGFGLIVPLVVYFAMRDESEYVRANAREALNFHLSLLIYGLCFALLIFIAIGIPLLVLMGIASLILTIIAAVKASDGECYRYPLTIRFVT